MPKDSRSIVIDYNVLKQNEDMGVGSTVDFILERGNRLFPSLYQDCLIPTRRLPGMEKLPLDGVLFFAPEALFHELHPEIASFDYSWSIVKRSEKNRTMWELN